MALKNRDGTPFRLSNPNPLAKKQQGMHNDHLIFHNFIWEGFVSPDTRRAANPIRRENVTVLPQNPTPIVIPVTAPAPEPEPEPEIKASAEKPANTVITYCLPFAGWQHKEDTLYGDLYKVPRYGEKFTFEAVVVEKADLAISLWAPETMMSKQGVVVSTVDCILPGSVVFPSKYLDGSKVRDHRWWKVQSVSPYSEGTIIVGVVTDVQPSFSD